MIATEAAAEGVNLQFCSLVVNFDLPWNPQRIEQRIGRCHRYGQKFDVVVVNFLNKENEADIRVYELLEQKFKLFDGVFGASDEVLGVIESGVEFEKRIATIYQTCRTHDEIQKAFDQLQRELEGGIEKELDSTRQKLLENFDAQVHDRLKINLEDSREYLNRFEKRLMDVTKYYLEPYAKFDHAKNSFFLTTNPFPDQPIHSGPYKLGKQVDDVNVYRIGHPLAQRIIERCKAVAAKPAELVFDYSNGGVIMNELMPYLGKSGWLQAVQLTVSSLEDEDHLMLAAFTDDGMTLSHEACCRLMTLSATTIQLDGIPDDLQPKFDASLKELQAGIDTKSEERNREFFDAEVEKLEAWAEDTRNAMRIELKDLEKEIKMRKTEARKLINLEQKIKEQRIIKDLEKKLAEKRYNQFAEEKKIEQKKDALLDEIEARLKQQETLTQLFTIRFTIN